MEDLATTAPPPTAPTAPTPPAASATAIARYWRSTLTLTGVLLAVWALAGIGGGILFAEFLNQWHLAGIPLGFWMAQQGSILVFVCLILIYALSMGVLERRYRRDVAETSRTAGEVTK